MVPSRGPSVWKVPGSDGLALVVASSAGSPSVSAAVPFRFPKACFVCGVLVLLRPLGGVDMALQMANTSLQIEDETNQPIVNDTRGLLRGTNNARPAAGLLMLSGRAFHPFALQRPVAASDTWRFRLQNEDTANVATLSGIFLFLETAKLREEYRP